MLALVPVVLSALLMPAWQAPPAGQQTPPPPTPAEQVRTLFQTGQDAQVIATVGGSQLQGADLAPLLYVAAQSHERLQQPQLARDVYTRLAAYPEDSPWRALGESGLAIAERRYPAAVTAANRAVTLAPTLSDAHFGLGKSLGYINNFAGSAAAFEQAALLDANQAYAYYYAGLAYNQAKRVDLMARNFETFLRLAPTAPERARVESIMRTIRK